MYLPDLLEQKKITKYKLSKLSGVPFTTISEITTGKSNIKNCTGDTLYRLAKALDVTIEDMLADSMIKRPSFENYKSTVCHMVKRQGDLRFIIETLKSNEVRKLYNRRWYLESFYLLAMIDYLSRENDLPLAVEYEDIRGACLQEVVYPAGVIVMSSFSGDERYMNECVNESIPEFMRHNIVESEIRNVY